MRMFSFIRLSVQSGKIEKVTENQTSYLRLRQPEKAGAIRMGQLDVVLSFGSRDVCPEGMLQGVGVLQ